ncbi:hypothetical protein AGMMS4952_09600 [Spirochaetia bacterium]|nr:hypothetical protein AGMMS4952_09600 [Spirochaetia bacterium]
MDSFPNGYVNTFEETIMKYLLFLVHVQQSIILPSADKIEVFDLAKKIARSIDSNVKSYLKDKNEFNLFEKNKIVTKAFDEITKKMEKEFRNYKRDIIISNVDFSYYNMIETLTDQKFDIRLTRNDVKQMLSYRELLRNHRKEKRQNKQLEDLKEKQDKEFTELRKKTFRDMLHGNTNKNSMRFFEVNDYILRKTRKEDIKYSHDPGITIKEGIYFIETRDEHSIKLKHDDRFIEYSFRVIDLNDGSFIMYIQGHIKVNNQKEEFYINETYLSRQISDVFYAYNLKPLIDLFNDLSMDDPDDGNTPRDPKIPNDIDDFLSGKIE